MTRSASVALRGSQVPTYRSAPRAETSAVREVVDLAASAGLILDDSQRGVLDDALGERRDGTWAADEVAVLEPRQNGKGSILEARALAGLYLFSEPLILWTAHEFKTAKEAFLRVKFLIDNNDHLRRRVKAIRVAAGEEGVELLNGCRLRFLARSGGSGRGFGGTIFLDEAYALTDEQMAALLPTLSAQRNPQAWYMSSAPLATSLVLRRLAKRGRAGAAARLAYSEWCAPRDAASGDREAWAAANPALGTRISLDAVQREFEAMDDETFRRERLGIWNPDDDTDEAVIDATAWKGAADPASQIDGTIALALDVTPDRAAGSIGVAGLRGDGLEHIEVIDHRPGTSWMVHRAMEIADRWHACALAIDPGGPAGALLAPLEAKGFRTEASGPRRLHIIGSREAAQAAGAFLDALSADRLRHLDQAPLNAAVAGARTRPLADAWAWSRRHSGVDISPLVAVTLARHALGVHAGTRYDVLDSIW